MTRFVCIGSGRWLCRLLIRGVLLGLLMPSASLLLPTSAAAGQVVQPVAVGQRLQSVQLRGLNGPSRALASYFGQPLLINMWASWCEPCRDEMKSFDRLAWLPIGRRIRIVGVSTDDSIEEARDWLRRSNATINQYIDTDQQLERLLGATTIPLTVLVAADGTVLARVRGAREWDSEASQAMLRRVFSGDLAGRRIGGGGGN